MIRVISFGFCHPLPVIEGFQTAIECGSAPACKTPPWFGIAAYDIVRFVDNHMEMNCAVDPTCFISLSNAIIDYEAGDAGQSVGKLRSLYGQVVSVKDRLIIALESNIPGNKGKRTDKEPKSSVDRSSKPSKKEQLEDVMAIPAGIHHDVLLAFKNDIKLKFAVIKDRVADIKVCNPQSIQNAMKPMIANGYLKRIKVDGRGGWYQRLVEPDGTKLILEKD